MVGSVPAYYSAPDDDATRPGLILIEEIWGVNDHIKDMANRFAALGYRVLAPEILPEQVRDALTPDIQLGLFDPEKRNEMQPLVRAALSPIMQPAFAHQALATLSQCVDMLNADEHSNKKVAVLGFCFGGTFSYHLAAHESRLSAAVPFYGHPPQEEEVATIACPILAFYGERDTPLMDTLPAHGKEFDAMVYPDAGHAFMNDTNPFAYNKSAAQDAWARALHSSLSTPTWKGSR